MMIQMPSVPQYILESSFCLVTFYIIYFLLLRKETFHHFNKYYLLSTALVSVLLPFIDFNVVETVQHASDHLEPLIQYRADLKQFDSGLSNNMFYTVTIGDILKGVFYIGVFLAALKFLYTLFQILDKVKKNKKGYVSSDSSKAILGASLFSFLYWNDDLENESGKTIIRANSSKLSAWHSIDVIIMELIVVLNWLNPLIYLFRNRFYRINEYIVDESVAEFDVGRKQYAKQLMNENIKSDTNQNRANYTSMIDRIMMLTKNRTSSFGKLKPLLVIPMAFVMLSLYSFDYADKLPDGLKSTLVNIESSIQNASDHVVLNLTHSKRNYEWEFRWGSHLFGLTSKDVDGYVKYDMSKEISLYDLYESIETTPSYKMKGVYESMGFDIKITSNSDTVSNISVQVGDYEGLGDKMKKEIVKHKTPFSIYFSNIGSSKGKRDGGFMITVHQYLSSDKKGEEEQDEVKKIKAEWGDLDLTGSDMGWIRSTGNMRVFERMNSFRYAEKPNPIEKKEFINNINDKFQLIVNDEKIGNSEGELITLAIRKAEFVKTNVSWNPEEKTYVPTSGEGSRVVRSISSVYHGRTFTSVQEEYDFKEMLHKGEVYIKDMLSSVTDGDVITITVTDSLDIENGNHFFFNMTINDVDAAYKTPYEVELPSTSESYTNFQIYYNVEDDKTYVKVDTTASGNENIVKAYRHSASYELMHVPDFKTKTRVNDTRVLPSGILKVDPDMDLTVSVQRMERLNEHYTLSDRMIRMDWGRMVSMPGIGNFSAKEFNRSSLANILLSAGDNYLDVSRFDLVIISEGREPTRIRTNNIKSLMCRQAFKELDGESSIYFDNIIINDNDEFKYYPYQFVFNVE